MEAFAGLFGPSQDEDLLDNTLSLGLGLQALDDCLPPECADGNIEYKLKLVNPTQSRFEHLVTQMKWRLREGNVHLLVSLWAPFSLPSPSRSSPRRPLRLRIRESGSSPPTPRFLHLFPLLLPPFHFPPLPCVSLLPFPNLPLSSPTLPLH